MKKIHIGLTSSKTGQKDKAMELQEALDEYEKYFGINYFHYVGFEKSEQEIIEEIQNCIISGKKQEEPVYDYDKIY